MCMYAVNRNNICAGKQEGKLALWKARTHFAVADGKDGQKSTWSRMKKVDPHRVLLYSMTLYYERTSNLI